MSDTCKFCGAIGAKEDPFYGVVFQCNTRMDYSARGADCLVGIARRYEALFPIPPWSTEPITAEMCRQLEMKLDEEFPQIAATVFKAAIDEFVEVVATVWADCDTPAVEMVLTHRPGVGFLLTTRDADGRFRAMTAGQLACLIAARKGAVK